MLYFKAIERIKEYHYCYVSNPEQWVSMLQNNYDMAKNNCCKKYKKVECWLYAEKETEFNGHDKVCNSRKRLFNIQLQSELSYLNVYDVHCRLV